VTLDVEINSVVALMLVDSSTTRFFMYPKFAKEYNAILQPKLVSREVRVIDE